MIESASTFYHRISRVHTPVPPRNTVHHHRFSNACLMQAAQPALLYIVPAMLGCVAIHAAVKGELLMLFHWSEAVEVPPAAVETGGKEEAAGSGASVTLDSKAVKKQL